MTAVARSALDTATDAVLEMSRAIVGVAAQSLAATEERVTLPQYRTLVALSVAGEQKAGSLADLLGIRPSTLTRMCDRLVADGYIEREVSVESRREVVLSLTGRGRTLVRNETARRRRAIRSIVSRLDADEQMELVDALSALGAAAEHVRGDAWRLGWTA